jgi:phosphomannomutase
MAPKFGTSGLRGLVAELTPDLVADHLRAFLAACPHGGGLWVGEDLRDSSPAIAGAVAAAARGEGVAVVRAGAVPTPALAQAAMAAGQAAVMVTGSHIPADRNGLKFYTPQGELTKAGEAAILAARGRPAAGREAPEREAEVGGAYAARIVAGFGAGALSGMRIGVWEHSSVARDLMHAMLRRLGAQTVGFGRAEGFVPVDTEAVDGDTRARIAGWVAEHRLDALVSTDGDADRPLVAGEDGAVVPGDVLGPVAARLLGAEAVCTPVSSNGLVEGMGMRVVRTRIGSPYVIAAMEAEGGRVAGYEANGGFLLGFDAEGPGGPIAPLMTRDAGLPMVVALVAARAAGGFAALRAGLPARFTAADRLQGVDMGRAGAFLARLDGDAGARGAFLAGLGLAPEEGVDRTDGLRMRLAGGEVLHLRPSGNAPEFRVYAEGPDEARARALLAAALKAVGAQVDPARDGA